MSKKVTAPPEVCQLHPQDEAAWLDPDVAPEQAQACLAPFPAALMHAYAVSLRVNTPAWNSPEARVPVGKAADGEQLSLDVAASSAAEPA